jgi:hypothetical protein
VIASTLRTWRKPVLWGALSLVALIAVLDRDLDKVVHSLPTSALGGGFLAVFLAASAVSLGARWSRLFAGLVAGATVVYAVVVWYSLSHQGLLHQSVIPWLIVGCALACWMEGCNRWSRVGSLADLLPAAFVLASIAMLASGASVGLQSATADLLQGQGDVTHSTIAFLISLLVLVASRWAPNPRRSASPDARFLDHSLSLSLLLRYPGLSLGALSVARISRLTWLRVLLGAVALVPLGIGLSEGMLVLGPLVAGLGCWLGWELSPVASALVEPTGILGILPRTRGSYGRRAAVMPALLASLLLVIAVGIAWRESYLIGFGTVLVLSLGCGVGFIGAGVALRVMAAEQAIVQARWVSGVLVVALAGCALAPLVQLNNAFAVHGLFFEYVITGTSFSAIIGLVGISLMSWWQGEVRDS